jgi:hypothetical protein
VKKKLKKLKEEKLHQTQVFGYGYKMYVIAGLEVYF